MVNLSFNSYGIMLQLFYLYFILLISLLFVLDSINAELLFIQMVWRHGDRSPITVYPSDPNPESIWEEGLGQLTLLGKKQQYAHGKLLLKMYDNFTTGSPLEVKIISSDSDRCRDSAETNLAAFYSPPKEWKFVKTLDWQPFSVYYIPREVDRYLEDDSYCPEAFKEKERIFNSAEGKKINSENEEMYQYLSKYSGLPINDWINASYLFDTLKIEKKYNLTLPDWTTKYWDQLRNVSNLSFYWSFNTPLMLRLRAGPLIGELQNNILKKIKNETQQLKVQIYSAHDTTVALLLQGLDLYNMQQPPYCATVILELHQIDSIYAVRFLYLNSSFPETGEQTPHILILKGCSEYCPLDYFLNYTKNLIPSDWEVECKINSSFEIDKKSMILGIFFTILVLFVISATSYGLWKFHLQNRKTYSYQFLETNIN